MRPLAAATPCEDYRREDEESTGVAYGGVVVGVGRGKRIRKACLIERQDY